MNRKQLIVILMSVLLWFAFAGSTIQAQEPASSSTLEVILLIDSSWSTIATDPDELRITSASFLLDYLEATSKVFRIQHKAGIAFFGGELSETIELELVREIDRDRIEKTKLIGYTDFRSALEFALTSFNDRSSNKNNTRSVILFTDGRPQLTDEPLSNDEIESYFRGEFIEGDTTIYRQEKMPRLVENLYAEGVELFVVAIGDAKDDAELWKQLLQSENHYYPIESTTNLADLYREFITDLSGVTTKPPQLISENTPPVSITLSPYLEQVIFSFIKDETNASITVTDSSGIVLEPDFGGGETHLYEIYSLPQPDWDMNWQVRIKGGDVQMWVDQRLPTLEGVRDVPRDPHDLEEAEVELEGWLLLEGEVVEDDGLDLSVTISNETNHEEILRSMDLSEEGYYELTLDADDFEEEGFYTATLAATLDGKPIPAHTQPVNFSLFPAPKIKNFDIDGRCEAGNIVTLTVDITHAGRLPPDIEVKVYLLNEANKIIDSMQLRDHGEGADRKRNDGRFTKRIEWKEYPSTQVKKMKAVITGKSTDDVWFDDRESQLVPEPPLPPIVDSTTPVATRTVEPATPVVTVEPTTPSVKPTPPDKPDKPKEGEGHLLLKVIVFVIILFVLSFMLYYYFNPRRKIEGMLEKGKEHEALKSIEDYLSHTLWRVIYPNNFHYLKEKEKELEDARYKKAVEEKYKELEQEIIPEQGITSRNKLTIVKKLSKYKSDKRPYVQDAAQKIAKKLVNTNRDANMTPTAWFKYLRRHGFKVD